MRVLLDTHVWLWTLLEPERLPVPISEALGDAETESFLSPISVWETLILARKRRLSLEPDPAEWVRRALRETAAVMAPLTHEIALRSEQLAGFGTRDPADRLLVATALVEGLAVATIDGAMLGYPPLRTVS